MSWRLAAKVLAGLVAVAILSAASAYLIVDWLRPELEARARADLTRRAKADRFVALPRGVMHLREAGPKDGPVVLLVHGGAIGGYAWRDWQAPLAAAGYHVLAPDLLGYGYSERPSVRYDRAFYVHQLSALLSALHVEQPVHIVGASMGGAIVTAFAVDNPARIASVTLIAPAGGGRHPVVSDALLLPGLGDWVFRLFGASQTRAMMRRSYPHSAEGDQLVGWMDEQGRYRGFGEGMLNTLRHYDVLWQPRDYQALGRSGLPVLALWGTADTTNDFTQSGQLLAWVPQLKLVPLEGKRHAITFGDAPLLLEQLLPFLGASSEAAHEVSRPNS